VIQSECFIFDSFYVYSERYWAPLPSR